MKIINPDKKSDFIVRELHNFSGKFESLLALKSMLINDFEDQVPPTPDFQVGYFLGKQSTKYWLMCEADLQSMYKNIKKVFYCGVTVGLILLSPLRLSHSQRIVNGKLPQKLQL